MKFNRFRSNGKIRYHNDEKYKKKLTIKILNNKRRQ